MTSFDVQRFLAALPRQELRKPAPEVALSVPWPRVYATLMPYNGFSSLDRAKMGAAAKWLRQVGALILLPTCEVCGSSDRLGHHSENYADPRNAITLCQPCHFAVHRRFTQPAVWARRVANTNTGSWMTQLQPSRVDIKSSMGLAGVPVLLEANLPAWVPRAVDRAPTLCDQSDQHPRAYA